MCPLLIDPGTRQGRDPHKATRDATVYDLLPCVAVWRVCVLALRPRPEPGGGPVTCNVRLGRLSTHLSHSCSQHPILPIPSPPSLLFSSLVSIPLSPVSSPVIPSPSITPTTLLLTTSSPITARALASHRVGAPLPWCEHKAPSHFPQPTFSHQSHACAHQAFAHDRRRR